MPSQSKMKWEGVVGQASVWITNKHELLPSQSKMKWEGVVGQASVWVTNKHELLPSQSKMKREGVVGPGLTVGCTGHYLYVTFICHWHNIWLGFTICL